MAWGDGTFQLSDLALGFGSNPNDQGNILTNNPLWGADSLTNWGDGDPSNNFDFGTGLFNTPSTQVASRVDSIESPQQSGQVIPQPKQTRLDRLAYIENTFKTPEGRQAAYKADAESDKVDDGLGLQSWVQLGTLGLGALSLYLSYNSQKDAEKKMDKLNDPVRQADEQIAFNNRMAEAGFDRYGNPVNRGGGGGGGSSGGGGIDTSNTTNPFLT